MPLEVGSGQVAASFSRHSRASLRNDGWLQHRHYNLGLRQVLRRCHSGEALKESIDSLGSVSNKGDALWTCSHEFRQALARLFDTQGVRIHHKLNGVTFYLVFELSLSFKHDLWYSSVAAVIEKIVFGSKLQESLSLSIASEHQSL